MASISQVICVSIGAVLCGERCTLGTTSPHGWLTLTDVVDISATVCGSRVRGRGEPRFCSLWSLHVQRPMPRWISHVCARAHAATFYITTANRLRTNALRTPLRYPSQQLASCCLHAWKCFACWIGSDLGTPLDVTSDLLTEHNHIRWFHIQNPYLNSLRGHNEHWRVLGVCQQPSTTCVWCDILHEVFCLIARSEKQLRSS